MIITRDRVLTVLSRHVGKANGRSIVQLTAEITGCYPSRPGEQRKVREFVTALREDGIAICAHPHTGYFIAENAEELDRYYIAFLRARAMRTLKIISRATKIPLPELLGQLRLET